MFCCKIKEREMNNKALWQRMILDYILTTVEQADFRQNKKKFICPLNQKRKECDQMRTAVILLSLISLLTIGCKKEKTVTVDFNSQNSKFSYAVGNDIGQSIKDAKGMLELPVLMKGIEDALSGAKSVLTPEEAMQVKQAVFTELQASISKDNTAKEAAFLQENGKKPGVVTTASGLQYEVVQEGKGPKATKDNTVTVHYAGTLLDGREFDSSYKRGEPAQFPVGGVIQGWVEGLQLMNAGSKYKFYIPAALAYGERGAGNTIPPHSTLIFDVELLKIN
jgi:FKBP-type peptidyl-prolyl cis-trans isomerase